jgi:dTMP kinase
MNLKPQFITFEGIEGSGKSTQAKMLYDFLVAKNIPALLSREPGGTIAGEKIRAILIDEQIPALNATTELLLNFAARIEHVEKLIKPALKEKKIVIIDRFFDSTYVYQGSAFGLAEEVIKEVKKISLDNFLPDITFLIDVPVEIGFSRISERSTNNRYEKLGLDFHQKVREGYLKLAKENKRIITIDGTQDKKKVFEEIVKIIA